MVLKVGEDYTGIKPVVTKKKKDPLDTSAPEDRRLQHLRELMTISPTTRWCCSPRACDPLS